MIAAGAALGVLAADVSLAAPEDNRIRVGRAIAPVPLDLAGKNRKQVWLGSYIVNAQGGCNDCHTAPPYAAGGDPFLGEPEQINTGGYLCGGGVFGPVSRRTSRPTRTGCRPGSSAPTSSGCCAPEKRPRGSCSR